MQIAEKQLKIEQCMEKIEGMEKEAAKKEDEMIPEEIDQETQEKRENLQEMESRCLDLEKKNAELTELITLNAQKRLGTKAGMTMRIEKLEEENAQLQNKLDNKKYKKDNDRLESMINLLKT